MLRIAFVTEVWSPSVNGVVTRLRATVTELAAAGHQVLVIAPGPAGAGERLVDGVTVRAVPTFGIGFIYGGQRWGLPLPRVGRWLAEFTPDVVHVLNPILLGTAGVIAARRRRYPLVCSYHTDVTCYAGFYRLGWLRPVLERLLRSLYSRATLNLATSNTGATQLRAALTKEQPNQSRHIGLWAPGVDLNLFRPPPTPRQPNKPVRVLYVGRLAAEKNLTALTDLAHTPGIQLVLAGEGPHRATLARQLAGTPAQFTGNLHGPALAAAYATADVFVFPSSTETLGLVLLEALAAGLPIIAADSPTSQDILRNCPAARLYPNGETGRLPELIHELLAHDRGKLARQARAHVAGDSWAAATAGLLAYYHRAQHATTATTTGG